MKTISDEILNRFIDGELTPVEINELNSALESDHELLNRLKALKLADRILNKMEADPAPESIVQDVMSKVKFTSKVKESVSPFFIGIISFFSISILAIVVYSFLQVSKTDDVNSQSDSLMNKVNETTKPIFSGITEFLSNDSILFIGGMIAFTLLLGFYFMLNTHKSFKQSLERF